MPIPRDKVFIGGLRPATMFGTHFAAVIVNMIVTLYAFVFTDSLWALCLALPVHGVCVMTTQYDPHAFWLIWLRASTLFQTLGNVAAWKCASRAPYAKRRF
jgi:type IV secretory pathway VirB3-like protein